MMNIDSLCGYKSMLDINFTNIEELIFHDREAQKMLPPSCFSTFEQWRIAKRLPMLGGIGKQAVLDLLNNLTEDDVLALETYFGDKIVIEKLNYSISRNIKVPLAESTDICNKLCEVVDFNYFSTWRDNEYLYISFWR
jgi:hypothetical protein